jgi:hypothetical protein
VLLSNDHSLIAQGPERRHGGGADLAPLAWHLGDAEHKNKNIKLKLFVNREVSSLRGGDFGDQHDDAGRRIEAQVLCIINHCISGV